MLEMDPEEREAISLSAQSIADMLTLAELASTSDSAWPIAENLRTMTGDDVGAARVAQLIAALFVELNKMTPVELANTLDGSISAYALAAGHLAGVYELLSRPQRSDLN